MTQTMKLTVRQTARVAKVLGQRFPREVTIEWSRQEYRDALAKIAAELYG